MSYAFFDQTSLRKVTAPRQYLFRFSHFFLTPESFWVGGYTLRYGTATIGQHSSISVLTEKTNRFGIGHVIIALCVSKYSLLIFTYKKHSFFQKSDSKKNLIEHFLVRAPKLLRRIMNSNRIPVGYLGQLVFSRNHHQSVSNNSDTSIRADTGEDCDTATTTAKPIQMVIQSAH